MEKWNKYFGINKSTIFKIFIITFDVLKSRHILTVKPYYVKIKNNNYDSINQTKVLNYNVRWC